MLNIIEEIATLQIRKGTKISSITKISKNIVIINDKNVLLDYSLLRRLLSIFLLHHNTTLYFDKINNILY